MQSKVLILISFSIKLAAPDANYEETVLFSMPKDKWFLATRYWEESERLRKTTFVQKKMGGSISISMSPVIGIYSCGNPVDEDAVGRMLMELRPFVLQSEDTYFYKTKNTLSRYIGHPVFRRQLSDITAMFELQRIQFAKSISTLGAPPLTFKDVMDWLNSFEYHRDDTKRKVAQKKLGLFGADRDGLPVFLFAAVEVVQAVLHLGDFIETILEYSRNEKVVEFPAEWVQELGL